MILEIAQIEIRPGKSREFEAAMAGIARKMAGCRGYRGQELQRDVERPDHYYLIAKWDRLENHTVDFAGSPVLREAQQLLEPLLSAAPVVHHAEVVFTAEP
jgi:heme-degrading monooxygenase HmoA